MTKKQSDTSTTFDFYRTGSAATPYRSRLLKSLLNLSNLKNDTRRQRRPSPKTRRPTLPVRSQRAWAFPKAPHWFFHWCSSDASPRRLLSSFSRYTHLWGGSKSWVSRSLAGWYTSAVNKSTCLSESRRPLPGASVLTHESVQRGKTKRAAASKFTKRHK